MDYSDLMMRLGYNFKDVSLLETALTHPSYGQEYGVYNYQRLEFLGDAVLELVVSHELYEGQQDMPEGKLTRVRAALVREESLCQAARGLGLGQYMRLSAGEAKTGGREKPSILADMLEAIIAASYIDGGLGSAMGIVKRALGDRLVNVRIEQDPLDYKTRLQELIQSDGLLAPTYEMLEQSGTQHEPVFTAKVIVGDRELGRGTASSKRQAQQFAAKAALESRGIKL